MLKYCFVYYFVAGASRFILKVIACSVELKIPCECMAGSQLDVMTVFLLPGEKLLILQFLQASWLVIDTCIVRSIHLSCMYMFFTYLWSKVLKLPENRYPQLSSFVNIFCVMVLQIGASFNQTNVSLWVVDLGVCIMHWQISLGQSVFTCWMNLGLGCLQGFH